MSTQGKIDTNTLTTGKPAFVLIPTTPVRNVSINWKDGVLYSPDRNTEYTVTHDGTVRHN